MLKHEWYLENFTRLTHMIYLLRRTSDRSRKMSTRDRTRSSEQEHMENALASGAEEGRDKLR